MNRMIRIRGAAAATICAICVLLALCVVVLPSYARRPLRVEEFNPKRYKGRMGKISLPYRGQSSLRVRDKKTGKLWLLSTTNGTVQAPVGAYEVFSYEATATSKNKETWSAYCGSLSGKASEISVRANATQKLDVGPPFTASIEVTPRGRNKVGLDLKILGRDSDPYIVKNMDDDSETPGFRVLSKAGKVLWQGSFKYG